MKNDVTMRGVANKTKEDKDELLSQYFTAKRQLKGRV